MALVRGNTSIRATGNAPGPLTLSHTVASGTGRILFVAATLEDGTFDLNTPTFNGVSMTLISGASVANAANKVRWYYLLNPDVTTANISFTSTGGTSGICFAAVNYTGWPSGGVPVVAATNTASSTTAVDSGSMSKAAGDFFLAAVSMGDATRTTTWTNATEWGDNQGNSLTFSVAYYEGTNTTQTITATADSSTSRLALSVIKLVESAGITVSVDDDTPSPTQAIVITKSGGNWNGTPTATLTDNAGADVAMPALTSVSGAVATLTLGAGSINNYDDANATWERIRWNQVLTLKVTDGDGTGTDTLTIIPPVDDHFDTLGASGVYVTSPGGANDDSYVHVVSGDGEGLPILADLAGNTVPTTARFLCFDVSQNKWLAQIEHTFNVASAALDGEYADAFTGTNGTLITAHSPDADIVGDGYTIEKDVSTASAVSNAVTIQSNQLYINDANEGAVIDVGTNEPDFEFDWVCATGKEFVAHVRRIDDTEHIHMYVVQSTGLIRVNERVSSANIGVTGTNSTNTTFTNGVTYRFRIQVVGTQITVYVDGVQQLQVSSTRAGESHATKVGLFAAGAGTFPAIFDNANVYSDYAPAAITLSLSTETPNPGDTVTVTVNGGTLANTSYTGTLNGVSATLSGKTTGGCTLTIPGYDQFDAAGTMVNAGWYRNLVFQLNDGTNTPSITLQVVPDEPSNYGVIGADALIFPPTNAKFEDECYVRILTGYGVAYPATCNVVGVGTGTIMAFDPVLQSWLAARSVGSFSAATGGGGAVAKHLRRIMHRRA